MNKSINLAFIALIFLLLIGVSYGATLCQRAQSYGQQIRGYGQRGYDWLKANPKKAAAIGVGGAAVGTGVAVGATAVYKGSRTAKLKEKTIPLDQWEEVAVRIHDPKMKQAWEQAQEEQIKADPEQELERARKEAQDYNRLLQRRGIVPKTSEPQTSQSVEQDLEQARKEFEAIQEKLKEVERARAAQNN